MKSSYDAVPFRETLYGTHSPKGTVLDSVRYVAFGALLALAGCAGFLTTYGHDGKANEKGLGQSNDRCTVYTYCDDIGMNVGDLVDAWKETWSDAGWNPVVLNREVAQRHPDYDKFHDRFTTYPSPNPPEYEFSCYLRWAALSVMGGGYMVDYDVVNVNVPPPPDCAFMPNDGKLTILDKGVPSFVSGSGEEYDRAVHLMYDTDYNLAIQSIGGDFVSDMIYAMYFVETGSYESLKLLTDDKHDFEANDMCNSRGEPIYRLFHLSHGYATNFGIDRSREYIRGLISNLRNHAHDEDCDLEKDVDFDEWKRKFLQE